MRMAASHTSGEEFGSVLRLGLARTCYWPLPSSACRSNSRRAGLAIFPAADARAPRSVLVMRQLEAPRGRTKRSRIGVSDFRGPGYFESLVAGGDFGKLCDVAGAYPFPAHRIAVPEREQQQPLGWPSAHHPHGAASWQARP